MLFTKKDNALYIQRGNETIIIQAWGVNSLRVRECRQSQMDSNDWALSPLSEEVKVIASKTVINIEEIDTTEPWTRDGSRTSAFQAQITNGNITAKVSFEGWISFYNQKGELLTAEYWRTRDRIDRYAVPLRIEGRELKPITGTTDFTLTARFEAFEDEHIYGMGFYQDSCFDR